MPTIVIEYSEDFGEGKIAAETYRRLRDNRIDPKTVITTYDVGRGIGKTEFFLRCSGDLPDESRLAEILEGVNLLDVGRFRAQRRVQ